MIRSRPLRFLLWAALVVIILLVLVAGFIARGKVLDERHTPFAEAPFDFSGTDFEGYIRHARELLSQARLRATDDETLNNLSPFILEPPAHCEPPRAGTYARGAVITHGLIASPFSMRPLADFFRDECFLVVGLLLPDHGTRPGDMLDSTREKWRAAQHFATEYLKQRADSVVLVGHSAGGTLSIHEAATYGGVDGLVLFAPALRISPDARFGRVVSWFGRIFAAAGWYKVHPDSADYRYESFPFGSAYETWQLIQEAWEALKNNPLQAPVFMVSSMEDVTVDVEGSLEFFAQQAHPASEALVYSRDGDLKLADQRMTVLPARVEDEDIHSLSHLGLMTPPEHPFYGREGSYHYCRHYYFPGQMDNYERCVSGERDLLAESTEELLQTGVVERIAYNPFYEDMLISLRDFLNTALPVNN